MGRHLTGVAPSHYLLRVSSLQYAAGAVLLADGQHIQEVFRDIAIGHIPAIGHPVCGVQKVEEAASVAALGICLHCALQKTRTQRAAADLDEVGRSFVTVDILRTDEGRGQNSVGKLDQLALADTLMSSDAVQGLRLFIGKAKCTNCHLGPLFTNSEFQDTGLNDPLDQGRAQGIDQVLADEFNCFGKYSDAKPEECTELRFMDTNRSKYLGKFKTPTLEKCCGEVALHACRPVQDP